MPQRHGSANKSIGGIYADKSTVTVAEGGAVQGNKASMGGGIYMNASGAAVARGSALYNNKAAYGGDDLLAFGDRKLTGDGKEITGRNYDGYKENGRTTRWSEEKDGAAYYDKYDAETGTANYALKAAHGLIAPSPALTAWRTKKSLPTRSASSNRTAPHLLLTATPLAAVTRLWAGLQRLLKP